MKSSNGTGSWFSLRVRWLVWSVYTVAWTTALLTPQPVEVAEATMSPNAAIGSAKLLHVSTYALLAVLSGWLLVPPPSRWFLLGFLSAHALGTEFFQRYVPMRTASWEDVGFDHVGIVLGLICSWKWWVPKQE